jgi:hypothetical protein
VFLKLLLSVASGKMCTIILKDLKHNLFCVARSRISALLKKLSPRSRHKAAAPNSPCPWVVVEFSKQDLESPDVSGRASSAPSDHSFDMAVQASRLRREQPAYNKNTHGQVYIN